MRILFAGTPEPAVVALRALLESEHEVAAVLSRPDARKGRGRTLHPSPVADLATQYGIPVLKPVSLKSDTEAGQQFRVQLAELQPECIPVVAYGNLVPTDLLDAIPHGWVNLHFSRLPTWRGAAPVQAAIANGDRVTGATTFRIEEGLDTGPIFDMLTEPIRPTDTADDLLARLAVAGADLLVSTITGLAAGTSIPVAQQGEPSYAEKIKKDDARIDWNQSAAKIDQQIRAYTPAPGAWTEMVMPEVSLEAQRIKVGPVKLLDKSEIEEDLKEAVSKLVPGELKIAKNKVLIGTGTDVMQLDRIQPPGKKMMLASDWARGLRSRSTTKSTNKIESMVWK